jgi:hypothetical protein
MVKPHLYASGRIKGGVEIHIHSFLAFALDKEKWSASIPGRLTSGKTAPEPTEQEAKIDTVIEFTIGIYDFRRFSIRKL